MVAAVADPDVSDSPTRRGTLRANSMHSLMFQREW